MSEIVEASAEAVETRNLPAAVTPMEMLDRAIANGASVETLEKLMDLQERWEKSEARKAFDAAMAALRIELPEIVKGREVDFTSSKGRTNYNYEDLSLVTRALSPVMAKHGLSFRWRTKQEEGVVSVSCIIAHRAGHSEETTLSAKEDHSGNKNGIQAIGSTVTYLQRYTLKAAVGVAASPDTDGNEPEPEYDIQPWVDRISSADKATLDELGVELRKAQSIPAGAMTKIRRAWAYRRNELGREGGQ